MDDKDVLIKFSKKSQQRRERLKVELVFRLYSTIGLLMAAAGAGYFVLSFVPIELTSRQLMSVIIAGAGLMLAVLSRLFVSLWHRVILERYMDDQDGSRLSEFITNWSHFEMAMEARNSDNVDAGRMPIRTRLSRLAKEGRISKEQLLEIDEALRVRNAIVHGGEVPSSTVLERLTEVLQDASRKISYLTP